MTLLGPKTHRAPVYFRRAGRMFFVAATVTALLGIVAPDNLGRGFAALFTAILALRGVLMYRKAARVSPNATVHEQIIGKNVGYQIIDDDSNSNRGSKF